MPRLDQRPARLRHGPRPAGAHLVFRSRSTCVSQPASPPRLWFNTPQLPARMETVHPESRASHAPCTCALPAPPPPAANSAEPLSLQQLSGLQAISCLLTALFLHAARGGTPLWLPSCVSDMCPWKPCWLARVQAECPIPWVPDQVETMLQREGVTQLPANWGTLAQNSVMQIRDIEDAMQVIPCRPGLRIRCGTLAAGLHSALLLAALLEPAQEPAGNRG